MEIPSECDFLVVGAGIVGLRRLASWPAGKLIAATAEPELARLSELERRVVPFRGAYLELRADRAHLIRANLYSVPDPGLPFLRPHLTRGSDGRVLLGPTALVAGARDAYQNPARLRGRDLAETLTWPGSWRLAARHWRAGLDELRDALRPARVVAAARLLVPDLRPGDFVRGPAGIRAQAVTSGGDLVDDFIVSRAPRAVHVRNAPSPAATSALALARLIADEAEVAGG